MLRCSVLSFKLVNFENGVARRERVHRQKLVVLTLSFVFAPKALKQAQESLNGAILQFSRYDFPCFVSRMDFGFDVILRNAKPPS